MREIIATGATVEEATENACRELGLSRFEVTVEVLEMPVKKLFKTIPAKVRVAADSAGTPAETPVAPPAPPASAPKQQAKPAPVPKAEKKPAPAPARLAVPDETQEKINLSENPAAQQAADYLTSIFNAMGVADPAIVAYNQGEATLFMATSEEIANVMEVRGEGVQALSYLVDRTVNKAVDKRAGEYLRVRLDIAGYRDRRETELLALAKRTAEEVQRTGRSRTLAPMNSYERLIIHTAIGNYEGLVSESIGADVERRVVVKSTAPGATDGGDWRPRRSGGKGQSRGRDGNDNRRDGRPGDRDRRSTGRGGKPGGGGKPRKGYSSTPEREYADRPHDGGDPIVPDRREAIRDGEDMPLYGKIEL